MGLRFGLWYAFRNPPQWPTSYRDLYAEVLEQIEWGESIGYDDVWLTEHHFCDDGHAPSPLVIAGAVAARTKRMRIGTGVMLLPLYDPVRVAEDCATIDVISGGRFELGVGVGYRVEEFEGLGIDRKTRGARTNEALEIIRRLWAGETVTFESKHFRIRGARVTPPPIQQPPPIWVGGFSGPAVRRAAKFADGFIGTGDLSGVYPQYLEELRKLGRPTDSPRVAGGHFWLIVAEDPEKAWSEIAPHVLYQINVYAEWLEKAGQPLFPHLADTDALRASGILQILTPEDAVAEIRRYTDAVPLERYYTWSIPPGYPVRKMNDHLELFARKVMPHFR